MQKLSPKDLAPTPVDLSPETSWFLKIRLVFSLPLSSLSDSSRVASQGSLTMPETRTMGEKIQALFGVER